jgi:hypothetical protein
MFNNFILNILTLEEAMIMNEIADIVGLDLSEMNGSLALFNTFIDGNKIHQIPIAIGLESVVNKLAEEVSAIFEKAPSCEILYSYKRTLRVIQMKIIKNMKQAV